MIAVIRIKGQVGLNQDVKETLHRLRLRKKYVCVIFDNPNESQFGMIKKMRDFISYGEISQETYKNLVKSRGKIQKDEFFTSSSKNPKTKNSEEKLKPFFRLHPPRGGAKTKLHYPKGILGENKEMDKLVEKML